MVAEKKSTTKAGKAKSSGKGIGKTAKRRAPASARSASSKKLHRIFEMSGKKPKRKVHVAKKARAIDLWSDLGLSKSSKSRIERVFKKVSKEVTERK
jgi:hypothetical protein